MYRHNRDEEESSMIQRNQESSVQFDMLSADTWDECGSVLRRHGRTFFVSSRLLAKDKRRSAEAIYAFCRIADDIVDHADAVGLEESSRQLAAWEAEIDQPHSAIAVAFRAAREYYDIPVQPAYDLIAGVRTDLARQRFASWDELRHYCYCVAGTVGLLVAPILGCRHESALPHAIELGIAMQLTNILRDVAEDALLERLYLPLDELALFGVDPDSVLAGTPTGDFSGLLQFQSERARDLYASAAQGFIALDFSGQLATITASHLYARILDEIERQGFNVFAGRARVSRRRKVRELPVVAAMLLRLRLQTAMS